MSRYLMKKYVLVDGYYVELETWKSKKPDIKEPPVISLEDTVEGMSSQHIHEMKFKDMRRFCKANGIEYSNSDKKVDLIRKIELYHEERNV